jgi:predicted RNase H-like HicB family nuclease
MRSHDLCWYTTDMKREHQEQSVKAAIYFDGEFYCVRCSPIAVFTQGKTLDEAVRNTREAVALHLEGDHPDILVKNPSIVFLFETALKRVA